VLPVDMPHGDRDDDLLEQLDVMLAHVQYDTEWMRELLCHEIEGPMIFADISLVRFLTFLEIYLLFLKIIVIRGVFSCLPLEECC